MQAIVHAKPHPERLIFLDVDGVLNSKKWFEGKDFDYFKHINHFDPQACALLNTVIEKTGCGLVLSSSWRIIHGVPAVKGFLHKQGCPLAKFFGATPALRTVPEAVRGDEIAKWLEVAEYTGRFVILDDSDDMGDLMSHLVHTNFADGLTQDLADEVVKRLTV